MQTLLRLEIELLRLLHAVSGTAVRRLHTVHHRDEDGQATAEYALVLVAAVAIAGLLIAWAKKTNLLDTVMDNVFRSVLGGGGN